MTCQNWTPPTVAEFKAFFFRDFPYAPADAQTDLSLVVDQDIQNAINLGQVDFNAGLFGANTTLVFMYLAAHNLVINLRNSSAGLNSQAKFALDSMSVGSVSLSYNINELFAKDPFFSGFLKTGYGQKYLDLVYPYTVGNVKTAIGTTTFA